MKCRHAQSRLAVYSAENLSDKELAALCEHLAGCPDCNREWIVLQSTLFTLSTSSQPVLSSQTSEKMWLGCRERLMEQARQGVRAKANPIYPLAGRRVGDDFNDARPTFVGWLLQPQLGWATLGAAVAILGSVWMLTPAQPEDQPPSFAANLGPRNEVSFERPPEGAMPLLSHHAAMSIDPFNDHVGRSLVSYSPQR